MPTSPIDPVDARDPAFLYLNLRPTEEIRFIVRHHWAGFLGTLGIVLGMALVPLVLVFAAGQLFGDHFSDYMPLIVLALSGYFIFLLTFLFGSWINFYYDIIFITNERIINVAQEGLLSRQTSELDMRQIENVSAEINGLLQSFFNYGLLIIETAGKGTGGDNLRPGMKGYFTVTDVPDPNQLARTILEFHRATEQDDT